MGQLIQRMFISTTLQPYAHIAFLDTPGYSKPDTKDYSARTDEQIAREQLNHSDFILWFVNGSVLPQTDIDFLKQLDTHIPKAIILNKADKVLSHGMDEYHKTIESIQKMLLEMVSQLKAYGDILLVPLGGRKKSHQISRPFMIYCKHWMSSNRKLILDMIL